MWSEMGKQNVQAKNKRSIVFSAIYWASTLVGIFSFNLPKQRQRDD